ncbi:MAG: sigma-54-dependent Fis family transcriptional regulator [Bacteroidales bacterium]|nr:sigma-54-dependent Fis family transcriptional regulator [Bacteroidales bacterium]
MKKILVIDDEDKLRNLLTRIISYEGFDVYQAGDCKTALKKMTENDIDVVLCDVRLPDGNGVEFINELKKKYPLVEVILLTAYGNIPDGVKAIKNGAFDYITKGDENNKIVPLIYNAVEKVELAKRVQHLEKQLENQYSFENIIGKSELIQNAIELAKKVAESDTSVLLTGETGTGKEVFAQAIHHASSRKNRNFVAINCSAFSHDLLESEFFGHKAGAFTSAIKDRKGLFSEANNGTIFLDEIGELATDLQVKLLRVIETGEFLRVGDNKPTKINVRIIAATNRDLRKEIEMGNFREDLYYRISVFQIRLPALRERTIDVETLSYYFLQLFAAKSRKRIDKISEDCLNKLKQHQWRGNTRELRNVIERCVILARGNEITTELLPVEIQNNNESYTNDQLFSDVNMASIEKQHIKKVLNYTNGNKTKAAELLGIALTTLYRKLSEYNIN